MGRATAQRAQLEFSTIKFVSHDNGHEVMLRFGQTDRELWPLLGRWQRPACCLQWLHVLPSVLLEKSGGLPEIYMVRRSIPHRAEALPMRATAHTVMPLIPTATIPDYRCSFTMQLMTGPHDLHLLRHVDQRRRTRAELLA